nr:MCP four helix bundle domain-containing protein [Spirochaetales bacterium]
MNKPLLIQFNQWKIGTRLSVGFSMVLFLFILVSIFNWNRLNDTQSAFVLYSQVSATATSILEVDHQITELQSAILVYSQTGHKAREARINDRYAKLQKNLASIRPYFTDPDHQSLLVKMDAVLSTYNEIIDTLFADRKLYDQYTKETLPQAANDVRTTLENLSKFVEHKNYPAMQSSIMQITENFLSALVDANSFFAVRNYALQRRAKTSLAEAVKIWSELQNQKNAEELQVLLKDLGMAMTIYTTGFNQALQVTRGYLFLVNVVIPGEAAEFENLSLNFTDFTLKHLKKVATNTEKNVRDSQQKTSIMAAIGIVFGVILAFFISKSIVTPLQTISATFRQLIKRERVDKIPGLD